MGMESVQVVKTARFAERTVDIALIPVVTVSAVQLKTAATVHRIVAHALHFVETADVKYLKTAAAALQTVVNVQAAVMMYASRMKTALTALQTVGTAPVYVGMGSVNQ